MGFSAASTGPTNTPSSLNTDAGEHRVRGGPTRRRVAWGLLDQVVSSASNFVVTIMAARALSANDFGVFALGMAGAIVTAALMRGVASDPLASAHAGDEPHELRRAIRGGGACVLWGGVVIAALLFVAGVSVGGPAGPTVVALAVVLPGIALQDYLRYAMIVRGDARLAFLNDLLWLVIQVPAILLVAGRNPDPSALLLAWGASGYLCAFIGLLQVRLLPGSPVAARRWLTLHRPLWPSFTLDNLMHQANANGMLFAIALFTSSAHVGGVRAAMTLYAPLTVISRGVVNVIVPELRRRLVRGLPVPPIALRLALGMAALGACYALATLLLPDSAGKALLGDSWRIAGPVVVLAGFLPVAGLFSSGIVTGIRALGAARTGLTGRLVVSALVLVAASVGAAWDDTRGVFVLMAITTPFQALIWWRLLARAARNTPGGRGPQ